MRILVFGAGVLGCNLANNLFRAGKDVTLLARGAWAKEIQENGLRVKNIFFPWASISPVPVVTELKPEDQFDVIFVVVRYTQIETVLHTLRASRAKNIVFVGNNVRAAEIAATTVKNVGNKETGALGIVLEGTNKDNFVLSASTLSSIAVGGSSTFTVQPVTGLAAGTYTATVKVVSPKDGSISIEEKANVTFTVSASEQMPNESPAQPIVTPSGSSGSTTTIVAATVVTLPKSGDESRLALCAALMLTGAVRLVAAGVTAKREQT